MYMSKWYSIGGEKKKPAKSVSELEREIAELKAAKENIQKYNQLEAQRIQLRQDVKREGFKTRHKTALSLINRGQAAIISGVKTATSKKTKKQINKIMRDLKKTKW